MDNDIVHIFPEGEPNMPCKGHAKATLHGMRTCMSPLFGTLTNKSLHGLSSTETCKEKLFLGFPQVEVCGQGRVSHLGASPSAEDGSF